MARKARDFKARPLREQKWMLNNTWCDECGEADLGMHSPHEYEENGQIFVEGLCRRCGRVVLSEVRDENDG